MMIESPVRPKYRNAYDVLKHHWDGVLPVDPKKLAKSLGVSVNAFDLFDDEDGDLSGKFEIDDEGRAACYYNINEPMVRQRFTIAHELGHYVLGHGNSLRDPKAHFFTNETNYKEVEANNFAAQLLMPKGPVMNSVRKEKITSLNDLSQRFGVSEVAMKYRLKNLGLIS